tara:strand:- start:440 stop:715 length:276 start_codon:yes stop_codon:yes gene_type:complete
MVNQTIIPENFCDCSTQQQCAEYMKKNNFLNPIGYFELALSKIDYLLSQEQKDGLQDYIDNPETHYDPDFGRGWDIYCNILTVEQIQTVGY